MFLGKTLFEYEFKNSNVFFNLFETQRKSLNWIFHHVEAKRLSLKDKFNALQEVKEGVQKSTVAKSIEIILPVG